MVVFIIFWCAILGIVFFLISTVFKALASAMQALVTSGIEILVLVLGAVAVDAVLLMLYELIDVAAEGVLWASILSGIAMIAFVAVLICIVGSVGAPVLEIAAYVIGGIFAGIAICLEAVASFSESAYEFFLSVLIKKTQMEGAAKNGYKA